MNTEKFNWRSEVLCEPGCKPAIANVPVSAIVREVALRGSLHAVRVQFPALSEDQIFCAVAYAAEVSCSGEAYDIWSDGSRCRLF